MDTSQYEETVKVLLRVMEVMSVIVILFGFCLCVRFCSYATKAKETKENQKDEEILHQNFNP